MVFAAAMAFALSFSVYETYYSDGRESEDFMAAQSTNEISDSSVEGVDGASDLSEAPSAENQGKKDLTASQEEDLEEERAEQALAEGELDELAISGAVLDDAGQLVEGATVVAQPVERSVQQDQGVQTLRAQLSQTTDRLGAFEFRNLDDGEYELTATKGEDYFPATSKVRTGMANAELIMQRFRTIRVYGKISDTHGLPLDDVTVRTLGMHFKEKSDGSGNYEILTAPMRAGSPPVLEFNREGFEETRRRIEAAVASEKDEVQLDVQMEADSDGPKVAVAGQVLGPLGEVVEGVRVGLKSFKSHKRYSARTNESGEFDIPEVEVGDGYTLSVRPTEDYEAYQSDFLSLGPQDAYHEIELEAAGLANLSGTVSNLYGKPLSGFTLSLRGIGTSAQPRVPVQTDASGRFRLERLRAGQVALESRSQPRLKASNIVLEAGQDKKVSIPLDWGDDWLLGRVVNAEGQAVSGASIVVSWKEQFRDVVSESRREVRSDLEGYFTVSNLGAEKYTVSVQAPGYRSIQVQHDLFGAAQELVVQLPLYGN
jgi:hypothetical protein